MSRRRSLEAVAVDIQRLLADMLGEEICPRKERYVGSILGKICFVIAGLTAMLVAPAPSVAASPARDKNLAGAKKEARLVLYTGMDTEEANLYEAEFSKRFPFVKAEVFRASGERVQARFLVEHRTNTHKADVFQTSIVQVYQLKNAGLLTPYLSVEAAAYPAGFRDRQGH